MQLSSILLAQPKLVRALLVLAALYPLAGPAAQAQNIDEGKTAPRLFADSCVNCHRSPKGLAKGRFRPTLFVFLQDHYTASKTAAWELSSYLASLDTPQSSRPRTAASHPAAKKRPRPPVAAPSEQ